MSTVKADELVAADGTGGVKVKGFADASASASGYVGEVLPLDGSQVFSGVSAAASGSYAELKSVALTAGDWEITAIVMLFAGTSTTFTNTQNNTVVIGTTTASATGTTQGLDRVDHGWTADQTGTSASGLAVHTFVVKKHVSISSTTTYYVNGATVYSSTTPTWTGHVRAVRIR